MRSGSCSVTHSMSCGKSEMSTNPSLSILNWKSMLKLNKLICVYYYDYVYRYMCWFHTTSLFDNPPFPCARTADASTETESSSSILPLIDKITLDKVDEFVESAHSLSHAEEEIASPHKYRFKPSMYSMVIRKTSKRVRIEEDTTHISNTDHQKLDNFEKSLVEYWDVISLYLEENLNDIYLYCDAYQPYCGILNQCVKVFKITNYICACI